MIFKTSREAALWSFINPDLREQIEDLDNYAQNKYEIELVFTSGVRTSTEQIQLNAEILQKDPNEKVSYPSVHMYGNGGDIGHRDAKGNMIPVATMKDLEQYFNDKFPYGDGKKSALYHKGTSAHLHLQINMRKHGTGFNPNSSEDNKRLQAALRGLKPSSVS